MLRENSLAAKSRLQWDECPMGVIRLHGYLSKKKNTPRIRDVIQAASEVFGVPFNFIIAERRAGKIVMARHTAMYVAYSMTLSSTTMIGRAFGGRDHTTVIYAINKIDTFAKEGREDVINNIIAIRERALIIKREWLNDKVDG